jgi:hypothetical protein
MAGSASPSEAKVAAVMMKNRALTSSSVVQARIEFMAMPRAGG